MSPWVWGTTKDDKSRFEPHQDDLLDFLFTHENEIGIPFH